jgi:sporulation protein YlmC with PRC-barrel domain
MSVDAAKAKQDRPMTRSIERLPVTLHCGTRVSATDGSLGSIAGLVIDVRNGQVSHVVVTNADMGGTGRIVPLACVASGDGDDVQLNRSRGETLAFDRLTVPYDLGDPFPSDGYAEGIGVWLIPPGGRSFAVHDCLPHGSLVLRPPVAVRTKEGDVLGTVASWDIDPAQGRVRTIMVRRGHVMNRHLLPISGPLVDYIDDDGVHLTVARARLLGY